MSMGQEGECGGPADDEISRLERELRHTEDCLQGANASATKAELAIVEAISVMSLRWPLFNEMPDTDDLPTLTRALFDAFANRLRPFIDALHHAEERSDGALVISPDRAREILAGRHPTPAIDAVPK